MGFEYTGAVFKIKVSTIDVEQDGETITVPYTGIDHAVLSALANRANNETGKCWPGYGLLAQDTHFSRRAVSFSRSHCSAFATSSCVARQ
jgi:hypothetical protein